MDEVNKSHFIWLSRSSSNIFKPIQQSVSFLGYHLERNQKQNLGIYQGLIGFAQAKPGSSSQQGSCLLSITKKEVIEAILLFANFSIGFRSILVKCYISSLMFFFHAPDLTPFPMSERKKTSSIVRYSEARGQQQESSLVADL
ncbi:hypothetical protein NC651_033664 [Populus alba x Populus x berolinensis]|nr:hypothetical protein NC651_033664 [Populus alba x Populus x berolinensis]